MTREYFSRIGKLGAKALNSDPEKKSAAARKAADTQRAKNPDFFRDIARNSHINRNKRGA